MLSFIRNQRQEIVVVYLILAAVLIFRCILLTSVARDKDWSEVLIGDCQRDIEPAKALLQYGFLADSLETPEVPEITGTPLYPLFLAVFFRWFKEPFFYIGLAQIIFSIVTLLCVFLIARSLWNDTVGLIAIVLLSCDIPSHAFSIYVHTETLFTCFIVLAVLAGVRLQLKGNVIQQGLLMGCAIALATLVRPISYFLIMPVIAGFFIWGLRHRMRSGRLVLMLLMVFLPSLILIGGWKIRNFVHTGSFQYSYTKGDVLYSRAIDVLEVKHNISESQARERFEEFLGDTSKLSGLEKNDLNSKIGLEIILKDPLIFLRNDCVGLLKMLFIPSEGSFLEIFGCFPSDSDNFKSGCLGDLTRLSPSGYMQKWLVRHPYHFLLFIISMLGLGIFYSGVLLGLKDSLREAGEHRWAHLFIWGVIAYFMMFSAGSACARFRIPIMPLLAVYAGYGIFNVVQIVRNIQQK
ncbi:MAG: glycosyltransferase family 39 protein [Candidatus Omnitrophica bacterium]|nr:glycosyltransferase family 39 protein [Candidatus Omnitrophota bacterium]